MTPSRLLYDGDGRNHCYWSNAGTLSNIDTEQAIFLTNELLYRHTGHHLSEVQVAVFREAWLGGRKTYEQLAEEIQYSANYLKQGVGPRLWRLLSKVLGEKVTKSTAKTALEQYFRNQALVSPDWTGSRNGAIVDSQTAIQSADTAAQLCLERPAGVVPLSSPLYLERGQHQQLCCHEIDCPGAFIRIKAPRQMGKSSLLSRTLAYAKEQGCKTVILNFQQAEASVLEDINRLLRWVCANLALQLELASSLDDYWDDDLGSKMSCNLFLQSYILKQVDCNIVVAFEEVNELLAYPPVAREFLTLLRFWHERVKVDSQWEKLRLVMVHSTEIYLSLDSNQSPLNVGLAIDLKPFSLEESTTLMSRHGLSLTEADILQIFRLTGGHPFLLRLTLYCLATQALTLPQILESAATDTGIYHNHLHHKLAYLEQYPDISEALRTVLATTEPVILTQVHGFKLQGLGIVTLKGNYATISCQLYQQYFSDRL